MSQFIDMALKMYMLNSLIKMALISLGNQICVGVSQPDVSVSFHLQLKRTTVQPCPSSGFFIVLCIFFIIIINETHIFDAYNLF